MLMDYSNKTKLHSNMKKISLFSLLVAASLSFQACSNSARDEKDSVDAAEESNESVNNNVMEDDSDFMIEAADAGMMEIEAGKLAQANGSSQEVKDFGARMIAEHTKAGEELKALAADKSVSLPGNPGEDSQKHLDDMKKLKGADFDKHYVKMMVRDHDETVKDFEEAAKEAKDPDLKAWASKTLPVLKDHQALAKALHDKIK
jgi:putative membrane protein